MQKKLSTKEAFIKARNEKKKVLITYFSGEYSLFLTKLCVPVQLVPPIAEFENDYYYFWDDQADVGSRIFGLAPSEIAYLELTDEVFDPNNYIASNTSEV